MGDPFTVFICLMGSRGGQRARLFPEMHMKKLRSNRHKLKQRKLDNIVHNVQDRSLEQVVLRSCVTSSLADMQNLTGWGLSHLIWPRRWHCSEERPKTRWCPEVSPDLSFSAMLTPSSRFCLANQGPGCSQLPCVYEGIWELFPDSKDRWFWTCQRYL